MATIDIPDKICPHCGGTRWRVEYEKKPTVTNPDNIRVRYRCSTMANERGYKWRSTNIEKFRDYCRKKSRTRRAAGYYKKENIRESARLKAKKESEELANNFIKRLIMNSVNTKDDKVITRSDIPQHLIELKRKELLLTRKINNYGKDN